jgi:Leucine-rich repeat (LRR) protein
VLIYLQEIGHLENLEHLDVSRNCLGEVPFEISNCLNLEELNLDENYLLLRIPQKIFMLPKLVFISANSSFLMTYIR